MKFCPTCKATYADDANFCPQETCATGTGPQRLLPVASEAKPRFQLGPRIGGGSTGEVFRATDTVTGAQVAYKIVASDVLPNAAALARAEREFKQLMRVQTSRIATIVDCGRTPDERLFVAMELCEAESLDKTLRGTPMALDRAKVIVAQIGQALLEAQKAGIVHRDVAPKNVLLTQAGDVKVINFPLAKPINDRASGVAAYLSPEQVQGKPVDQRSNTYNLAALLYHLLTGEPPFQGTPETVLELHVGSPPLAPSQRRPEANLLPEVDRVILKALDKSSSRRHLTLRLFLSEVEALVGASAAPAAAGPGKDAGGFARTMLFAGGQAEVANLVAKAIAARGGSPAGGVPVTAPPAAAPPVSLVTPAAPPAAAAAAGARRNSSPAAGAPANATAVGMGIAATIVASPPAAGPVRHISPTGTPVSAAPSPSSGEMQRQRTSTPAQSNPSLQVLGSTPSGQVLGSTPSGQVPLSPSAASPSFSGSAGASTASGSITTPSSTPSTPASPPVEPSVDSSGAGVAMAASPGASGAVTKPTTGSSRPASAGKAADAGKGNAFRETLWFKKGDVEHMIAEARAKIASPEGKAPEAPSPAEEVLPIEDRYVDDGTVTSDDRKKFSLRAGNTSAAMPAVRGRVPGERMSDEDVLREVSSSRKVVVVLVAIVVVLAAAAAVLTLLRSKPTAPPSLPPAASLIPAPPGVAPPSAPAPRASTASAKGDHLPAVPELKHATKIVAAPPSKRDGSDKRATRRKTKDRRRR
jgi:hypothetical protein